MICARVVIFPDTYIFLLETNVYLYNQFHILTIPEKYQFNLEV